MANTVFLFPPLVLLAGVPALAQQPEGPPPKTEQSAAPPAAAEAAKSDSNSTGAAAPANGADDESDEELLKEIAAATKPDPASTPVQGGAPSSVAAAGASLSQGLSNIYNPAMSLNGLFLGSASAAPRGQQANVGAQLGVQELEMQFLANVDPYFAANLVLSIPEGEGLELEQGYLTPQWHPGGMEMRIGKIKLPIGRENVVHTHALPFVDRSLIGNAVFGEEGLSEIGLELSYLLPLPWYGTFTTGLFSGSNEGVFASSEPVNLSGLAQLKNVFDLNDDTTLEAGMGYAIGNNEEQRLSQAFDGHLVLKWHPAVESRSRELIAVVEGIYATRPNREPLRPTARGLGGGYGYIQWKLAQRWYTGVRYDYLGLPRSGFGVGRRGSAILVFAPTEFSAIRVQLSALDAPGHATLAYEGFVQLNLTLGAHPAHAY